ncbi:DUF6544 family protein [Planococcus sp. ISL-109]|uniref:DUF6920 family protein n=1 Tax=Planococcus sp. ISL-109 TaxID=2819166 RepID=UPI001BE59B8E|nr:DUF6544 family protein [Planococcus sp. ISL-109]MBT2583905.1 hypothetical protein [Planococcus sp. ISL-109]
MKRIWPVLGLSLSMVGAFGAYRKYKSLTRAVKPTWPEVRHAGAVTQEMVDNLPEPVAQWLGKIGAIGREQVMGVYVKQTGWMKTKPEQTEWAESKAEQYSFVEPPSFYWKARMKMDGLSVTGSDSFRDGRAGMRIRFAGLVPISRSVPDGKLNESALQRFLMEMVWCPGLVFSPYVKFTKSSARSVDAEMTYNGSTAKVTFEFDEEGRMKRARAMRYKEVDEEAVRLPCIAEVHEWQHVDGIEIPLRADITWLLDGRPFTWYKFTVEDAEINPRVPASW